MIYSENNNNINLISSGIDIDLSELELPDLFVDFKCRSKLEPEPVDDVWPLHQEKGSAVKFLKFEEFKNGTFLNGPTSACFFIYFHLFKHTVQILQLMGMWKVSIQYTVPGFELMAFGTRISSHNH